MTDNSITTLQISRQISTMIPLQKNKNRYLLLFILCFFNGFFSFGQNTFTTSQVWLDFNPSYHFNEKIEYYGNFGFRTDIKSSSWNQLYVKPSIRYKLKNNLQLEGGLGFFYSFGDNVNRFEIRPWQGARIKWPMFSRVEFKHIARIEERFSYLTDNWESSFNLRLRYKLEARFKITHLEKLSKFSLPLFVEFFMPFNKDVDEIFSNRLRFGAGVAYKLNKEYEFTFYYNWEKSRLKDEDQFDLGTNAFQLKLKKTFK